LGWIKVNTDGSFHPNDRSSGAGIIVRDSFGTVVTAACVAVEHCQDAEEVEAKAALEGIKLLSNLGHTKVILELDCVVVAKALCSQEPDRSKAWNTYEEAKVLMKAFQDHTISLVRRGSNCVADALAKLARCGCVSIQGITLTPDITLPWARYK
jgi:ribonuclease HI